ncbi:MAG: DUF488 domain-containing protein [Acidobacteriaceae bacterium]
MLTIGHSTLPIESFLRALQDNGCRTLVDVRTVPRSRHNPQFSKEALPASLQSAGIAYLWMQGLGGLRHTSKASINTAWKNTSFRGYADYMQTPEFVANLKELMALPDFDHVAVMCAEAVPWRCHRSLIGDAVLAHGGTVEDIFVHADGSSVRKPHAMTKFAQVEGSRVWYPDDPELFS